jgi:hypothetical protein
LRELANLVAAALVVGQVVGEQPLSWPLVLAGGAAWVVLIALALVLSGEEP